MNFKNKFLVLIALMALTPFFNTSSYAADNDVYKDPYTTEDVNGLWTFTNFNATGLKTGIHVIDSSADTTSSVTAARTGNMWVLRGRTGPTVGGVGYTLLLPTAASGLTYTVTSATNQTISVKTSGSDIILFGSGNATRLTSPASTGTTLTIVGNTGAWYVQEMSTSNMAGVDTSWQATAA